VVFQLCGQRPIAEIAAELAAKLKLGLETKPPEEQIAAANVWLGERRALLMLDDIWENDVKALEPRSAGLAAQHVAPALSTLDFADSFAGSNELLARRGGVDSPTTSARKAPKNIVTRCLSFQSAWSACPSLSWSAPTCCGAKLDPVPEAARGLRLEKLRNEVHDVAAQLRRAITARPEQQRRLLDAMAVCAIEGFWLPLAVEITGLTEAEGRDARNSLAGASLLRMLDRDRQRFQLHAFAAGGAAEPCATCGTPGGSCHGLGETVCRLGTTLARMPRMLAGGDPGCEAFVGEE
jgi:hypothetical protein